MYLLDHRPHLAHPKYFFLESESLAWQNFIVRLLKAKIKRSNFVHFAYIPFNIARLRLNSACEQVSIKVCPWGKRHLIWMSHGKWSRTCGKHMNTPWGALDITEHRTLKEEKCHLVRIERRREISSTYWLLRVVCKDFYQNDFTRKAFYNSWWRNKSSFTQNLFQFRLMQSCYGTSICENR